MTGASAPAATSSGIVSSAILYRRTHDKLPPGCCLELEKRPATEAERRVENVINFPSSGAVLSYGRGGLIARGAMAAW